MSDLISRQAAIDGVKTLHLVAWKNWHEPSLSANTVLDMIRELPSAQPQRMRGRWIRHNDWVSEGYCEYSCSECDMGVDVIYNYCPRCGADMREGQDG